MLGFVGNTGDAFASPPHLHFEVHPHQLLRLRYDGAVDPTTYLNSWLRMRSVHAPFPVHPRLPRHPRFRREARQVFRQLLVARHLIEQPTTPIEQPEVDRPARRSPPSTPRLLALREEAAMPTVSAGSATPTVPLLFALLVIAVFVATPVLATMVLGVSAQQGPLRPRSPPTVIFALAGSRVVAGVAGRRSPAAPPRGQWRRRLEAVSFFDALLESASGE